MVSRDILRARHVFSKKRIKGKEVTLRSKSTIFPETIKVFLVSEDANFYTGYSVYNPVRPMRFHKGTWRKVKTQ